jgi:hypothetical protein
MTLGEIGIHQRQSNGIAASDGAGIGVAVTGERTVNKTEIPDIWTLTTLVEKECLAVRGTAV